MATNENCQRMSMVAGADLSDPANCYRFVKGTRDAVVLCTADTDDPIGILHSLGTLGRAVDVCTAGISKLRMNAVVAAEVNICSDTDARGKAAVTGDRVRAKSLQASTAIGDEISVLLKDAASNLLP